MKTVDSNQLEVAQFIQYMKKLYNPFDEESFAKKILCFFIFLMRLKKCYILDAPKKYGPHVIIFFKAIIKLFS